MSFITFKKGLAFQVFISNEVSYVSSCRHLSCINHVLPKARVGSPFTPNIGQTTVADLRYLAHYSLQRWR